MQNSNSTPSDQQILTFFIALKSGSLQQIQQLLHTYKSAIANRLQSQTRQPPLYFAVINSDEGLGFHIAKMLVENGANEGFKDANEQTVMFYACRDGKRGMVEWLLGLGVRIDEEDLYGQTPLFYAASENRLGLLDLFSPESKPRFNAVVNHVDKLAKQTPLYYAARKGYLQMCKALIDKGADVNHLDSLNKTAVEYAKKSKFQQVVDYLTSQSKKSKELSRAQSQNVLQSSQNQPAKKRKKQALALNMNKNNYKITVLKQNGETHDLTEQQVKQLCKTTPQLQTYMYNPDSIPQQLLQSTLQETWQKSATKILNTCWKLKGAYWFYQPVDPVKFGILDYFDIITRPMDLGTVKKKLNYNGYRSAGEFVEDVRQIFKNCYQYNGEHHEISGHAKEVEGVFEEGIKQQGLAKFLNE